MTAWTTHTGAAVCLSINNIDTDQIIPARFMSQPRAEGYADFLLHDLRRNPRGNLCDDFILNRQPAASVLLVGRNFGIGSSREAAVYALLDSGVRVLIGESFGDIFAANAVNNGVLPARVSPQDWQSLRQRINDESTECTVALDTALITMGDYTAPFSIDETRRLKLINGWDDTDFTRQHQIKISQYRKARVEKMP